MPSTGTLEKKGEGYLLHADVEEVVLNATVLSGTQLVENLTKDDFTVMEDGVKQNIISFQHTDLPVSMGLVVDNSGSMYLKRPSVNKSAIDLIEASNPQDEAFVVNFSDEAFIDCEFTADIKKLRDGLSHIDSRGGTALYDAVAEGLQHLQLGRSDKHALIVVSDGGDNASRQTYARILDLARRSNAVIYAIGLLGTSPTEEEEDAGVLVRLCRDTGGVAYFPQAAEDITGVAAHVAGDIREQYTLGFTPGERTDGRAFRKIEVMVTVAGQQDLKVRTRAGYLTGSDNAGKGGRDGR